MELNAFVHQYCLYYKESHLVAGWISGIQKEKLSIAPLQGRDVLMKHNRLALIWSGASLVSDKPQAHQTLRLQLEQAKAMAKTQDLETIYELMEPGCTYTIDDMAADFLDEPSDPLQRVALFLALEEERRLFKRKNDNYIPRTAIELEQFDQQLQRIRAQQQWQANVKQWLLDIEESRWTAETELSQEQQEWVKQLQSVLVYGKNSGYWKTLAPVLNLGSILENEDEDRKLRAFLQKIGQSISWCRLVLLRASVRYEWPTEVLEVAERLAQQDLPQPERKDWTSIATYTVDAAKTQDYDDALSVLEWTAQGVQVVVHIADLSDAIASESVLFQEAEKRLSSVYTLKHIFPMFPSVLSNGRFSLKAGEVRPTVGFQFHLFRNGNAVFQGFEQGLIQVEANLSYEAVDQAIEANEGFWKILSECCEALRQKRKEKGALSFSRKEVEVDISNPEQIRIVPLNRNTPANGLVEELAILVNQAVGRFFQEHECPGVYRTQAPYEIVEEVPTGQPVTPEHVNMEPVRLSTIPDLHSGLGCDYYMQATSPIRRFVDLVSQQQLVHYQLTKTFRFDEQQMMGWAEQIDSAQKLYNRAERDVTNHWKAKYLAQHTGEVFPVTVRRHLHNGRIEVIQEDIQYIFSVSGLETHEIGTILQLRIESVDMERHLVLTSLVTS